MNWQAAFQLRLPLTDEHIDKLFTRFNTHYQLVKESMHKDEFTVLEPNRSNEGRFFTHQNSICFDFADLMRTSTFSSHDHQFFERIRSEIPRMPGVVPSRDNASVGSVELDEDVLKTALKEGIRSNSFPNVRKILSTTGTNQCLFDVLGRDFFAEFDSNSQAQQLFVEIRRGITDAATSNRYNQIVRGQDAQLVLTPEMARALYVTLAATKPLDLRRLLRYSAINDVLAILSDLEITGNITATAAYNNDIVIDTSRANVTRITAMIEGPYAQAIHLTNAMAASLYKEVTQTYGVASLQYQEMMALSNQGGTPSKLMKALELLHIAINVTDISYPNQGRSSTGYIIRNVSDDNLRTIREIHDHQANRFVLPDDIADALYARIQELDPRLLEELMALDPVDKLEAALNFLNINYSRIEDNPAGGQVIFMPASEQAIVKATARIPLNAEERQLTEGYVPRISPPNGKSPRGFMLLTIWEQARAPRREPIAPPAPPTRRPPTRTRPEAVLDLASSAPLPSPSAPPAVSSSSTSSEAVPFAEEEPLLHNSLPLERALREKLIDVMNIMGEIRRGAWFALENDIVCGRSHYSGALCLADSNYQLALEEDHRIATRNKRMGFEIVSSEEHLRVLSDFCLRLHLDVEPMSSPSPERASATSSSSSSSRSTPALEAHEPDSMETSDAPRTTPHVSMPLNIPAMLDGLIEHMNATASRPRFFVTGVEDKLAKLVCLRDWSREHLDGLNSEQKNVLLALIRDVCAIKRSHSSFLSSRSLCEFNERISADDTIDHPALSEINFAIHELSEIHSPDDIGRLIGRKIQERQESLPPPQHRGCISQ